MHLRKKTVTSHDNDILDDACKQMQITGSGR